MTVVFPVTTTNSFLQVGYTTLIFLQNINVFKTRKKNFTAYFFFFLKREKRLFYFKRLMSYLLTLFNNSTTLLCFLGTWNLLFFNVNDNTTALVKNRSGFFKRGVRARGIVSTEVRVNQWRSAWQSLGRRGLSHLLEITSRGTWTGHFQLTTINMHVSDS